MKTRKTRKKTDELAARRAWRQLRFECDWRATHDKYISKDEWMAFLSMWEMNTALRWIQSTPSDIIQTLKWTFVQYDMFLFDRFLFGNDLFGNMIAFKNWWNRSDSNLESLTLRLSIQSHGSTHWTLEALVHLSSWSGVGFRHQLLLALRRSRICR